MKKLIMLTAISLLVGCQSIPTTEEKLGPYPDDYKNIVKNHIKSTFYDPYSLRDAELTPPVNARVGWDTGWAVCLRTNGKNRMGGYTGMQTSVILIRDYKVISTYRNFKPCYNVYNYEPYSINGENQ